MNLGKSMIQKKKKSPDFQSLVFSGLWKQVFLITLDLCFNINITINIPLFEEIGTAICFWENVMILFLLCFKLFLTYTLISCFFFKLSYITLILKDDTFFFSNLVCFQNYFHKLPICRKRHLEIGHRFLLLINSSLNDSFSDARHCATVPCAFHPLAP